MSKILSFFGRQRTECSLSELLLPHVTRLYRQAYKYCGNESDAEDLMQEVMLECSEREQQLRDAPVPAAWLSRVLYHRFVDRYRKQKKHNQNLDIEEHQLGLESQDSLESEYLHQQLIKMLDKLSKNQRMVICLHDMEGYTLAEISEVTEIPIGTLKSHLHRGRNIIKSTIKLQPHELIAR